MTADEGRILMEKLEKEIDAHSLYAVLECLRDVANEKYGHVAEAWQDRKLANEWLKAATILEKAGARIGQLGIPQ